MRRSTIPDRATRAMEVFGLSESLIGDLQEEFPRRGSRLWYWRQTAAAIAVLLVEDVRAHKGRALRCVAGGWTVLFAWAGLWSLPAWVGSAESDPAWLAYTRYPQALGMQAEGTSIAPHPLLLLTSCLVAMAAAGLAGRISRPGRGGLVLFLSTIPIYVLFAGSQWIVGHPARVLLTFGITHALAMASALVAGLWSIPMREDRKRTMPRPLVYGGWALGGLGLGGLALGAALLTGQVGITQTGEQPLEEEIPSGELVWVERSTAGPDEPENAESQAATPEEIRVSPDGRWIAYTVEGEEQIRVFSVDGEDRIVEGNFPVWSSDGSVLYFRKADGGDVGAAEFPSPEDFEIVRQAV